jgi:uncharacterized protein
MSRRALLTLTALPGRYAISKLDPKAEVPLWAREGQFVSVTRTPAELSIVCPEDNVPAGVSCAPGWRVLKCEGPLDWALTGIVASLAEPLADAGVAIFPIATHDTEFLLIREPQLEHAARALTAYGHAIRT